MAQPRFPTKISPSATVMTAHQMHTHSMIAQASRVPRLAVLNTSAQRDALSRAKAAGTRKR